MKSIFTNEQIKFIEENYDKMSYNEIGKLLGFTERQIRGRVNNMGLTKNRVINSDFFKDIDTPLKAYFIGFIYADGWIVCNPDNGNYEFGMQLQSQDKYILEKLNFMLGNKNKITHKEPKQKIIKGRIANSGHSDILRVYSKDLVYNLINNGISTNKTKKDIYPVVKNELFFDFLRGYIDGDGCFCVNKKYITCHITCSSIITLKYIQEKLQEFNIDSTIHTEFEGKNRIYISYKDMKTFINHLYYEDDLFCLQRKYEKIKHLINGLAA